MLPVNGFSFLESHAMLDKTGLNHLANIKMLTKFTDFQSKAGAMIWCAFWSTQLMALLVLCEMSMKSAFIGFQNKRTTVLFAHNFGGFIHVIP